VNDEVVVPPVKEIIFSVPFCSPVVVGGHVALQCGSRNPSTVLYKNCTSCTRTSTGNQGTPRFGNDLKALKNDHEKSSLISRFVVGVRTSRRSEDKKVIPPYICT
jgi:hypothetical protein